MSDDYRVPPGADVERCGHCGRPFRRSRSLALHLGLAHEDALSETEAETVARARRAEAVDLRKFRLKALGGLVVVYFGLLVTYALV